jgi:hypothetical protein
LEVTVELVLINPAVPVPLDKVLGIVIVLSVAAVT